MLLKIVTRKKSANSLILMRGTLRVKELVSTRMKTFWVQINQKKSWRKELNDNRFGNIGWIIILLKSSGSLLDCLKCIHNHDADVNVATML